MTIIRSCFVVSAVWALGMSWSGLVLAEEAEQAASGGGVKTLSGMSVLGNNEAPKSLVIVPWKSSQIGDGIGVVDSLDNRPMPVDREVFARELDYYQIRTEDGSGVAVLGGTKVGPR